MASGVCGFIGTGGRLLENGDLLLVSGKQLQRWRGGEIVSRTRLSSLPALGGQDYDAARAVHYHAMTPTGETVLLIPGGGYMPGEFKGASFLLLALDAKAEQRWRLPVFPGDGGGAPEKVWLAEDGIRDPDHSLVGSEMCIRDRRETSSRSPLSSSRPPVPIKPQTPLASTSSSGSGSPGRRVAA